MGHRLGTLAGIGIVSIEGKMLGTVTYSIDVWQEDNGFRSADGTADGEASALMAALDAGKADLALQSGGSVTFLIERLSGDQADIKITGPVPGFS
jgi:hypothetical protein